MALAERFAKVIESMCLGKCMHGPTVVSVTLMESFFLRIDLNPISSCMTILGRVVSPIVDVIDVDDIVQRIDVNNLLDRVDWNKVLDSVDVDRILERVDVNKLLRKVDVKELVERAEIPSIVARSTTGIFSPIIDTFRSQVVVVDQAFHYTGCSSERKVPPAPGLPFEIPPRFPKGVGNIAVAVQERYAGIASRALAFLLDQAIITILFFLVLTIVKQGAVIASLNAISVTYEARWRILIIFYTWQFIYYASALAATSKTIGKVILGLKVVNSDNGLPVSGKRAILRTLLLNASLWSVVGVFIGMFRKDRKELHDIVAGTGVVYDWDARMARYRQEKMEEYQVLITEQSMGISNSGSLYQNGDKESYRRRYPWIKASRKPRHESLRLKSEIMHL
jgi:uncharacterized RDD family membrane protein YckC